MVELAENVVFNVVAVVAALYGVGVWSLALAALTRSVVGVAMLRLYVQWRIAFRLRVPGLKAILLTGLGFQSFSVVSFLKDLALPAFMVAMVGTAQFGYFAWGRDLVLKLITFSRLFGKVAVPTMARLSSAQADLTSTLRQSSNLLGLFYWPAVTVLIGASGFYIPWVFSAKWLPAEPVIRLMALVLLLQVWASPMWALIQACSPASWPLKAVLLLTGFEAIAGYVAVRTAGITGAAAVILGSTLLAILLYLPEIRRVAPGARSLFQPFGAKLAANVLLGAAAAFAICRCGDRLAAGVAVATSLCLLSGAVSWLASAEDRALISRITSWGLAAPRAWRTAGGA